MLFQVIASMFVHLRSLQKVNLILQTLGCPPGWFKHTNSCYIVHTTWTSFNSADEECQKNQAQLAYLQSQVGEKQLAYSQSQVE
jgi:hypothetical protein